MFVVWCCCLYSCVVDGWLFVVCFALFVVVCLLRSPRFVYCVLSIVSCLFIGVGCVLCVVRCW